MTLSKSPPPPFAATTMVPKPALFKKSIKRDLYQCKKFKVANGCNRYQLHTFATARAKDLQDIIDPKYDPHTLKMQKSSKKSRLPFIISLLRSWFYQKVNRVLDFLRLFLILMLMPMI